MSLLSFSYFEHVCNFRRVQLSKTVNIRHCMRMNNFLSEAGLVSINICINQNYNRHENYSRNTLEQMILKFGLLFTRAEDGDVANLLCFKMLLSIS